MDIDGKHHGFVGHWIKRVHLESIRQVDEVLKPYGLARSQWQVLYLIDRAGALTNKQLHEAMGVESATVTGLVETLVRKRWLVQSPSPGDRRAKLVSFAAAARKRWRAIPDPIDRVRRKSMRGISAGQEKAAVAILQRIAANLEGEGP